MYIYIYKTLLHLAVEMNHLKIVQLLLNQKGININLKTV